MLARLVGFDTTSRNPNLDLIDFVDAYLRAHGAETLRFPDETGTKANLYAVLGPKVDGGVALSGHSDVVPVDGQPWDTDPFDLIRVGDKVFGRGTTDMKGFLAVALALVPEMTAAPLTRPIHFAISHDEEVGCVGVRSLIDKLPALSPRPMACIVGEPTRMRVVNAHKGIHTFRTTVTGREAHSSTRGVGVSAIAVAADLVARLTRFGDALAREGRHEPRFDVPHATISVGTIDGGTAVNIVPRACRFHWECRTLPGDDAEAVLQPFFDAIAAEVLPAMRALAPEADIATERLTASPGLLPQDGSPAEELVLALAQRNATEAVAYATEAGLFQDIGIPTVVCGPGDILQAHTPNEFIEIAQLEACAIFLRRLIDHLSQR